MIIKSIPEINMYSMLSNIWKIYEGSIICVIENIEQVLRYWCNVQRGVRQGCVTSGFLFIIVIDWMLRSTIKGERGIRWIFTCMPTLGNLDYADDRTSDCFNSGNDSI